MVLRSSQSDRKLPSIEMMPDSIKVLVNKIKQQHYEELYELEADGTTFLQDDLNEILQAFRSSEQTPKSFYVVEDLPNKEEINLRQTRVLEKIVQIIERQETD